MKHWKQAKMQQIQKNSKKVEDILVQVNHGCE
jgi:hypothetical protein